MPSMPSLTPFNAIKHLLPKGCQVLDFSVHRSKDDGQVLLCEGDIEIDTLALDWPLALWDGTFSNNGENENVEKDIAIVLVTGNLKVTGTIFSVESDGSIGLVVLGNVYANNMIVGGQEIFICGNLLVDQLFWGDYNHGYLEVLGNAQARVWMVTEQYPVTVSGELIVEVVLDDEETAPPIAENLAIRCFVPSLMLNIAGRNDETFFGDWLTRPLVLGYLQNGSPLLNASFVESGRPIRLPSERINLETVQAFITSPLIPAGESSFEVWDGDDYIDLRRAGHQHFPQGGIYLQHEQWGYFFLLEKRGWLDRCLSREPSLQLIPMVRDMDNDQDEGVLLSEAGTAHLAYINTVWPHWLAYFSMVEMEWTRLITDVTTERIEAILQLPYVVQTFADIPEEENLDVEWVGDDGYFCRLPPHPEPRVCVSREVATLDAEGDPDLCHYLFKIVRDDDGEKTVDFSFQPCQEEGGEICLDTYELTSYPLEIAKAWRAFLRLEKNMVEANEYHSKTN